MVQEYKLFRDNKVEHRTSRVATINGRACRAKFCVGSRQDLGQVPALGIRVERLSI